MVSRFFESVVRNEEDGVVEFLKDYIEEEKKF